MSYVCIIHDKTVLQPTYFRTATDVLINANDDCLWLQQLELNRCRTFVISEQLQFGS